MKRTKATGAIVALLVALPVVADCGKERWSVKTGSDPTAAAVNVHAVVRATVAELVLLSRDAPTKKLPDFRTTPPESTVYEVTGRLTNYKVETGRGDSDYHLVLQETEGQHCAEMAGNPPKVTPVPCTIVAEVPDPACVGAGSPFAAFIARARARLSARFPPRSRFGKKEENAILTLTRIGFFDRVHAQRGVAANGFELHPVLDVAFADEEDQDTEVGSSPAVPIRPPARPTPSKPRGIGLSIGSSVGAKERPKPTGEALSVGLTTLLYVPFILVAAGALVVKLRREPIDTARFQMLLWFGVTIASVIGAALVAAATSRHATDIEIPTHVLENLILVAATAMFSRADEGSQSYDVTLY